MTLKAQFFCRETYYNRRNAWWKYAGQSEGKVLQLYRVSAIEELRERHNGSKIPRKVNGLFTSKDRMWWCYCLKNLALMRISLMLFWNEDDSWTESTRSGFYYVCYWVSQNYYWSSLSVANSKMIIQKVLFVGNIGNTPVWKSLNQFVCFWSRSFGFVNGCFQNSRY